MDDMSIGWRYQGILKRVGCREEHIRLEKDRSRELGGKMYEEGNEK